MLLKPERGHRGLALANPQSIEFGVSKASAPSYSDLKSLHPNHQKTAASDGRLNTVQLHSLSLFCHENRQLHRLSAG